MGPRRSAPPSTSSTRTGCENGTFDAAVGTTRLFWPHGKRAILSTRAATGDSSRVLELEDAGLGEGRRGDLGLLHVDHRDRDVALARRSRRRSLEADLGHAPEIVEGDLAREVAVEALSVLVFEALGGDAQAV
jgi:hypothetical protein